MIVFHPCFLFLTCGSEDHSVSLYDISVSPPVIKYHLKHHTHRVWCVAFHSRLPLLATGSEDESIVLYDISALIPSSITTLITTSLSVKCVLKDLQWSIGSIVFHHTLPLLATSCNDNTVILYNLVTSPPSIIHRLKIDNNQTCITNIHPNLSLFVRGTVPGTIFIHNLNRTIIENIKI